MMRQYRCGDSRGQISLHEKNPGNGALPFPGWIFLDCVVVLYEMADERLPVAGKHVDDRHLDHGIAAGLLAE